MTFGYLRINTEMPIFEAESELISLWKILIGKICPLVM